MVELQIGAALRDPVVVRAVIKASAIFALTAVLCGIMGYVNLAASFDHGRLSVPPIYDDVSYFTAAARWLVDAPMRSPAANLFALLDQHAPFTTLTSAIGLSFVPRGCAGPYLVNVVLVGAFMLAVARLVWRLSLIAIAACLIGLACIPMLSQVMTEGRPDLPWGLALGLAVAAIFHQPLFVCSHGSLFLLGLLCGVAAAIKPSGLPASVALLGFAMCAATVCGCLETGSRNFRLLLKQASATLLLLGLGFLLGVAAIDGVGFAATVRYIVKAMISDRDFWTTSGSLWFHLSFYSVGGGGGWIALKYWFAVGPVLFAVRIWLSRQDRPDFQRALALLAVVAAAYAIPTASVVKTYFLGAIFYGPFIVTMVLNYVVIADRLALDHGGAFARRVGLRGPTATGLRLLPLAAVGALFIGQLSLGDAPLATKLDQETISDIRNATARTWSALSAALPHETAQTLLWRGPGAVVTVANPYPVNAAVLRLYAAQANLNVEAREGYFSRTLDEAANSLSAADFAIVTSSMPSNLPVPPMGDELIGRLDADPHMCLVGSITLLKAREMRLYRRSEIGCEFPARTGQ
jgi:hypothetical protein